MLNLTGIEKHKKLLSLLNSPSSLCVEYEISSKLIHLPFFVPKTWSNRWQVPTLTGVKNYKNYFHHWLHLICAEYKISKKLKHLLLFIKNYGLKDDTCQHWQVSRITKNYCHQLIQHLQIVHYVKFRGKWLTSFPVPRSPF